MQEISGYLLKKLERQEEARILREYERSLAGEGFSARTDLLLLRRFGFLLRGAGGLLLGGLIGAVAVLLTFIILNLVLHVG